VFHASSRRDSRSHVAIRVIRRKTNRRHMIGDHYDPTATRATLLVRTVDGILGTHKAPLSTIQNTRLALAYGSRVMICSASREKVTTPVVCSHRPVTWPRWTSQPAR
jgi:hypothetical protein